MSPWRTSPAPTPVVGAFESTYLPLYDVDVAETTQHAGQCEADLDRLVASGVRRCRYPIRWHRIEAERGSYDWSETDRSLEQLKENGVEVVVDLLHHTSHPNWLEDGLRDHRFPHAYLGFAEAVAARYPWLDAYTLFNEPFLTLFLAGHQALWPPYDHGVDGFVRLASRVLPAVSSAARCFRDLVPDAQHVWVDTCEHHDGSAGGPADYAGLANDRRHAVLDLALGIEPDLSRPFLRSVVEAGGERLFDLTPLTVDVLGLDYYPQSEWWYGEDGGQAPPPHPLGFAEVAGQYFRRYGLPMMLSETNLRGSPADRASWLRYMLEQYELAVRRGVPLDGFCWFPYVDSCDWDSLLARPGVRPDPVGVVSLRSDGTRERTIFTDVWEQVAAGARSSDLPAYRFSSPCREQLSGFLEQLTHWPWQDPPEAEQVRAIDVPVPPSVPSAASVSLVPESHDPPRKPVTPEVLDRPADLLVLSHLKWSWVWQRPQHLVSRFAVQRRAAGSRTWFVEEPEVGDVRTPRLHIESVGDVTRVWLVVPADSQAEGHLGFDDRRADGYGQLLVALLQDFGVANPDVLLYTPMALDIAEALSPRRIFYDVMDDLASFMGAPAGMMLRQRRALAEADVVFAGGRSLHRSVAARRRGPCYLFPSGVDGAHYASALSVRSARKRPVAGYVGVIDERIDLALLSELSSALPDWTIRVVGPVAKIDPALLPVAGNLEYPGRADYEELPVIMAGFDVALMPFALNESTRRISPTKTLEYLAAGLPVVSTRIADVVADFGDVVHFAENGKGFAEVCRTLLETAAPSRARELRAVTREHEWDVIAERMAQVMAQAGTPLARASESSA